MPVLSAVSRATLAMAAVTLFFFVDISSPFTFGPELHRIGLRIASSRHALSLFDAHHELLGALGLACVSLLMLWLLVCTHGLQVRALWAYCVLVGLLACGFAVWAFAIGCAPSRVAIGAAMMAAGGTPPWLVQVAAHFLVLLMYMPFAWGIPMLLRIGVVTGTRPEIGWDADQARTVSILVILVLWGLALLCL